MTRTRIIAVGEPPIFRQQVAQAADLPAETVDWLPALTKPEDLFGDGGVETDVLVMSASLEEDDVLTIAQLSARFSPTTAVVLLRDGAKTNGRLPSYMRAGIRDIVDLSQKDDLAEALGRAVQWSKNLKSTRPEEIVDTGLGKVITVFSSKGGTGKTFLATNLAYALAQKSAEDVAVVDLDFRMGDVFSYFGSEPVRPLTDLLDGDVRLDAESLRANATALADRLYGYGSPADPGIKEIPADDVGALLRAMRKTYSHVVLDSPAGYSDEVLPALDYSDTVVLVASLDVVGIKHLAKAIDTLSSIGLPGESLFVVLNRADSKVGLEVADVERVTKIKIDAMLPSSRLVPTSLNHGRPVVQEDPKSDIGRAIFELADRLMRTDMEPAPTDSATETKRSKFKLRRG